jgi:hypothetical protein
VTIPAMATIASLESPNLEIFGFLASVRKSAYDAVDGSHRRHLGAKVQLPNAPPTSPYG